MKRGSVQHVPAKGNSAFNSKHNNTTTAVIDFESSLLEAHHNHQMHSSSGALDDEAGAT